MNYQSQTKVAIMTVSYFHNFINLLFYGMQPGRFKNPLFFPWSNIYRMRLTIEASSPSIPADLAQCITISIHTKSHVYTPKLNGLSTLTNRQFATTFQHHILKQIQFSKKKKKNDNHTKKDYSTIFKERVFYLIHIFY